MSQFKKSSIYNDHENGGRFHHHHHHHRYDDHYGKNQYIHNENIDKTDIHLKCYSFSCCPFYRHHHHHHDHDYCSRMFKRTVINLSFISLSLSFLFLFANIDNSLATNMICHDDNGEHSTIGSSSSSSSSVSIFSNNNNKSQNHNNRTTIVSNSRTIFLINDNDDKIVTAANTNTNNNKKRDVHGLNDGKISQKFHRDYSSSTTLSTSSNTLNINFPNNNVDSKNVSSIQTANNEQPFGEFSLSFSIRFLNFCCFLLLFYLD